MENVRLLSASSINGTDVRNESGKNLGDIKDLMINVSTGHIEYAVLAFGGILGIGDKYFAVPWNNFRIDTDKEEFVINVSEERLKDAPGFDKDNWPSTADRAYFEKINDYYGQYAY